MSEANGGGLDWRVARLESAYTVTHNDVSSAIAMIRQQHETISDIRRGTHELIAKLNVLENLLAMLKDSLYALPERRKAERKKA